MYVFIDDSGDPGFKFDKGSSRFFVIACCVFETAEAAEETAQKIRDLRRDLRFSDQGEFKFSRERFSIHSQFFRALEPVNFRTRVIVMDKWSFPQDQIPAPYRSLEQFVVSRAVSDPGLGLVKALVTIDGKYGARYRQTSRHIVRARGSHLTLPAIRKVRFVDSRSTPLIQLADMVAGCAKRSFVTDGAMVEEYSAMLRRLLSHSGSSLETL